MQLVLFRHGIAEDGHAQLADADRALTREGIDRTRAAARGLARLIERTDAILTSPKTRALQTAAILGDLLNVTPEHTPELVGDVASVLGLLRRRRESHLVLVGHEPTLSELVETLCGGAARGRIEFKKAGAAMLEADLPAARGTLQWLLPPRVLRMLN